MRFMIIALATSVAFGQANQLFRRTQNENKQQLEEIATMLRATVDIKQVSIDDTERTVSVEGTAAQIAMADWLVRQMDLPGKGPFSGVHEYRPPATSDDVARVFELTNPETPQQLQEIVTLIRAIGDIQRLFINNKRRAVVLRATAERVALAAWLVSELDKPVSGQGAAQDGAAPHEYRLSSDSSDLVRVFYLDSFKSPEDRQKVVAQVRANARIQRLFIYNALGALAVRGTAGQVATAEKVLEEMKAQ